MARQTLIEKRLIEYGFSLAMFRRARAFFGDHGYTFGFGGRGQYKGVFHLSTIADGVWQSFRCFDPSKIMDRPSAVMADLKD